MRSIVKYLHAFLTPSWQVVEMQIATKQFNDTAQGNNKYVVNPLLIHLRAVFLSEGEKQRVDNGNLNV